MSKPNTFDVMCPECGGCFTKDGCKCKTTDKENLTVDHIPEVRKMPHISNEDLITGGKYGNPEDDTPDESVARIMSDRLQNQAQEIAELKIEANKPKDWISYASYRELEAENARYKAGLLESFKLMYKIRGDYGFERYDTTMDDLNDLFHILYPYYIALTPPEEE